MHKSALNLANVNGWIQRIAHVHDNVNAQQSVVARQAVQLHFGAAHPIDKIPVIFGSFALREVDGLAMDSIGIGRVELDSIKWSDLQSKTGGRKLHSACIGVGNQFLKTISPNFCPFS